MDFVWGVIILIVYIINSEGIDEKDYLYFNGIFVHLLFG